MSLEWKLKNLEKYFRKFLNNSTMFIYNYYKQLYIYINGIVMYNTVYSYYMYITGRTVSRL